MAMLAEKKHKQKWSLNPRGKIWSQDVNKFGQKMLEKMGWSQGKGLGANENGITESIRVSYKNDSKGMGYKNNNDQWTEHESNFSALLESLADGSTKTGGEEELKVKSLEQKSQTSRARVHYKKFTRGKDLSRYSEKDLANIFGKKTLKEMKVKVDNADEDVKDDKIEGSSFLYNSGSMMDYFKNKMPVFGKSSWTNGYTIGNNGVLKKEDDNPEGSDGGERRNGFGFTVKVEETDEVDDKKSTFVSYVNEDVPELTKKNKKKRKVNLEDEEQEAPPKKQKINDEGCEEKTKKNKQKKGKREECLGLANAAFDPLFSQVPSSEKHKLDVIEENSEQRSVDNVDNEISETKSKKQNKNDKKKVKKLLNGLDNPNFNVVDDEDDVRNEEQSNFRTDPEKKRKSKRKAEENGLENPSFADSSEESTPIRKKKSKNTVYGNNLVSVSSQEDVENFENPFETKLKKYKKKKQDLAIDNPSFQADDLLETPSSVTCEDYEVKRKKKKLKKSKLQLGLDNPALNLNDSSASSPLQSVDNQTNGHPDYDLINIVTTPIIKTAKETNGITTPSSVTGEDYEVKRKKKSKKSKLILGLDNPALNLNDSNASTPIEIGNSHANDMPKFDLMFNIVTTPILKTSKETNNTPLNGAFSITNKQVEVKRRKSVRFSDVTQERIIPNNYDLQNMDDVENRNELFDINSQVIANGLEDENMRSGDVNSSFDMSVIDRVSFYSDENRLHKMKLGMDNAAFDKHSNELEENLVEITKTIDRYEAEVENDINEAKLKKFELADVMVGEVGNPLGENEKLSDGTRLKFRLANFGATPHYQMNVTGAKKSYKHLIKGDIVLAFKNTNLHAIDGYATKNAVLG